MRGGHDGVMSTFPPGHPGSERQPGHQGPPRQTAPGPVGAGIGGLAPPQAANDPGAGSGRLPEGFVFPGTESINPFEVFSGPGYQAPHPRTDPVATAALVCALLSFIPGLGVLAAGFGWWSLYRLKRSWALGESQAWMGVVVGTAASAWWLWLLCLNLVT